MLFRFVCDARVSVDIVAADRQKADDAWSRFCELAEGHNVFRSEGGQEFCLFLVGDDGPEVLKSADDE